MTKDIIVAGTEPTPPAEAPSATTTVSVAATFAIAGQEVTISSQDITKIKEDGFKFQLANPVVLGSFNDLIDWMNTTFGTNLSSQDIEQAVNSIPVEAIKQFLLGVMDAVVTITVLQVDTKAGLFSIAVTASSSSKNPVKLLNILEIKTMGFGITRIAAPTKTP